MKRPRARPRFTLELSLAPDEVTERVRAHLARSEGKITGRVFRRTVLLTVCKEDTHFWSPHLDIQLDDGTDGGTRLTAMFSPAPTIWTAFLGLQLTFALLSLGAAVWVMSVWMSGESTRPGLVSLAAMLFGGGFSYGAAYVGQGIGSEQMYELRAFLMESLRDDNTVDLATQTPLIEG